MVHLVYSALSNTDKFKPNEKDTVTGDFGNKIYISFSLEYVTFIVIFTI